MNDYFSLNWLHSQPSISTLKTSSGPIELEYYMYGKEPQLCISSGMHGDEYEVISSVSKAIQLNLKRLPSFLYIPIITPSAVKMQTRNNADGQDVNRSFYGSGTTNESIALMSIVQPYVFNLGVSFHEDPVCSEFYMYDILAVDENKDISRAFSQFKQKLTKIEVAMFSGIDDPNDPELGFEFIDGYKMFRRENPSKENKQFEGWMVNQNLTPRVLTPEIPGKSMQEVKDKIVEAFFSDLVMSFF